MAPGQKACCPCGKPVGCPSNHVPRRGGGGGRATLLGLARGCDGSTAQPSEPTRPLPLAGANLLKTTQLGLRPRATVNRGGRQRM